MGLLDGGLKDIFGTAFAPILLDGLLHPPSRTDDAGGSPTVTFGADVAVKAVVIDMTDRQRAEGGYSERDVLIIVLQKGVTNDVDEAYEITAKKPGTTTGIRYKIRTPITVDPAGATWTLRGSPT